VRRLAASLWVVACALPGAACYTLRPVTYEQLGTARPGTVWITRSDQSVVVLETPRVFGDTLVGYINGEFKELSATELNPRLFRVRHVASARTAAVIAVAAAGIGTFVGLISSTGQYVDPTAGLDCEDPQTVGCPMANPR
jgi:hypothetical protein